MPINEVRHLVNKVTTTYVQQGSRKYNLTSLFYRKCQ
uniref:Uncharacterized protein n=1 Tax=Arundo donax TaxID=35708 RepID=A0A0A9H4I9_ARUDO